MTNRNQNPPENQPVTYPGTEHPSGLHESDLGYVSMVFWGLDDNKNLSRASSGTWSEPGVWERLLAFQQGWKACQDFYKINV